jgi:hypothetical protein
MPGSQSGPEPEKHLFEFEYRYQPWTLIFLAFATVGKQAVVLLFVFLQLTIWNPVGADQLLMHCTMDSFGWWAYPCEATKAFVRSFPLFAAGISMIVTGRYILQSRLWYNLLMKNVLLDYSNYRFTNDSTMHILLGLFICSLLHFVQMLFFPSYVTFELVSRVGSVYLIPCGIFFYLFHSVCDIEHHFVPLPKFCEEDLQWAKGHFARAQLFTGISIRKAAKAAMEKLQKEKTDGRYTLDEFVDAAVDIANPRTPRGSSAVSEDDLSHVHGEDAVLLKGLWPGRILLNPHLIDPDSTAFRHAFLTFSGFVIIFQLCLFAFLCVSITHEISNAMPDHVPDNAVVVGGTAYQKIGEGYCRGHNMQPPLNYHRSMSSIQRTPNMEPPVNYHRSLSSIGKNEEAAGGYHHREASVSSITAAPRTYARVLAPSLLRTIDKNEEAQVGLITENHLGFCTSWKPRPST